MAPRPGILHSAHRRRLAPRDPDGLDALAGDELDVPFVVATREWLRYVEDDRAVKPTTLRNYGCSVETKLIPAFGERRLHDITPADLTRFRATLHRLAAGEEQARRRLYGIFRERRRSTAWRPTPPPRSSRLCERRSPNTDIVLGVAVRR